MNLISNIGSTNLKNYLSKSHSPISKPGATSEMVFEDEISITSKGKM